MASVLRGWALVEESMRCARNAVRKRRPRQRWRQGQRLRGSILALAVMATGANDASAQGWPTPAGPYEQTRRSVLPLRGPDLVRNWAIATPGPPDDLLIGDIDGDPDIELVYSAGGRAHAHRHDGTVEWTSIPTDLGWFQPPIDLDGDARPELITRERTAGITVLRGRDGLLLWESSEEELSYVGQVLAFDFDGDGLRDVLAAEWDCGFSTRGVGRTVAWSFANPTLPRELFRLEEGTRDYHCGRNLRIANTDGSGSQVIALGNEFVYVYSTEDGALIEESQSIGVLPFGIAQMSVVDIEGDGIEEILLATNSSSTQSDDPRRLTLVGRNAEGALAPLWTRSVVDPVTDRHSFPPNPASDLDGDDVMEVVHAFYDGDAQEWTTFVRDAASGDVVATAAGEVVGLVSSASGEHRILVAASDNSNITIYRYDDGALEPLETLDGDNLVHLSHGYLPSGAPAQVPAVDGTGNVVFTLDLSDASGAPRDDPALIRNDLSVSPPATERFELAFTDGATAGRTPAGAIWLGVAHADGRIAVLDDRLVPANQQSDGQPNIASASSSLEAMLAAVEPATGRLRLGRGNRLFDASESNLVTPATGIQIAHTLLGIVDAEGDGTLEWIGYDTAYLDAEVDVVALRSDGVSEAWEITGLVERSDDQDVRWTASHLGRDIDGDGVADLVSQRQDVVESTIIVQVFSGASGAAIWPDAVTATLVSHSGPLSLAGSVEPRVATSIGFQLQIRAPDDGDVVASSSEPLVGGLIAANVDGEAGDELFTSAFSRAVWRAFRADGSTLWSQDSIFDPDQRHQGTGVSFFRGSDIDYLAEGRLPFASFAHNLVILDARTGEFLHRVYLEGGEVSIGVQPAHIGLSPPLGVDAAPGEPAYLLVGAADGFLYLLDPAADPGDPSYPANLALAVWNMGSPLGPPSSADIDGDGFSEVFVPTQTGEVVVMDTPDLLTTIEVRDTDCVDEAVDVDLVERSDRFCASWTPSGDVSDGYLASLVDEAAAVTVLTPVAVEGTSVTFSGAALTQGRRYRVEVQAYAGAGTDARSSEVYSSDGALFQDAGEPPTILDFVATPPAFVAGLEQTTLTAVLLDPSPLARFELSVLAPDGTVVYRLEQLLNTSRFDLRIEWDGRDDSGAPLSAGDYSVVLEAEDFTGLSSVESIDVTLLPSDAGDVDGAADEADAGDAGDAGDMGVDIDAEDAGSDARDDAIDGGGAEGGDTFSGDLAAEEAGLDTDDVADDDEQEVGADAPPAGDGVEDESTDGDARDDGDDEAHGWPVNLDVEHPPRRGPRRETPDEGCGCAAVRSGGALPPILLWLVFSLSVGLRRRS